MSASIMGVGATKRMSAVRWTVAKSIVQAWLFTAPVAALIAAISYWLINFAVN
ncbi:MAG TPA: inorganic phosphate transporter [Bacillota bacterium]|nr:inorganic phosphate transporter [Bacillota bacterium]